MSSISWRLRLLHALTRVTGRRALRAFTGRARDTGRVNADTLRAILHHNRDTEVGRRHGFATLRTVEDYQRALPLITYEPMRPAMERMARGEQNILTAERLEYLGVTSGTTGQRKLLPVTGSTLRAFQQASLIGQGVVAGKVPATQRPSRGMILMNAVLQERSEGGLLTGALTAISTHRLGRAAALLFTSPPDVYRMRTHAEALYLHLLFGLRERALGFLMVPFASGLLDMVHVLERRGSELLEDLARGVVRPELNLEPEQRRRIQAQLRPDPERARELAPLLQQGPQGLLRRLWPQLSFVSSIAGASFSLYTRQLAPYLEGVPLSASLYASTESIVGVPLELEQAVYCLLVGVAFFEFIPEQDLDAASPRTVLPEQLVEGESYELVLTTRAGLYRYRMGDVVRIVGRFHQAPLMEFLYRRGALLNLMGEKTSEHAARQSLEEALATEGLSPADYSAVEETEELPGRYAFFVELQDAGAHAKEPERSSRALEEALCRNNPFYAVMRGYDRLGAAVLHRVEAGTFQAMREVLVRRGGSPTQVKVPRVVRDAELKELLRQRRVTG
ncbi:GH3 auxin-responsive promoter family protein [Archangium violaceum]|uniref:GH3 auxin-responsive promoter family protein n=1 Tax=Archangium violaceum TaxID=83451 RepID=UPI002B2ED03B|nr:GH3 auxin-responsive promoter family protein [Archangium gephyra]